MNIKVTNKLIKMAITIFLLSTGISLCADINQEGGKFKPVPSTNTEDILNMISMEVHSNYKKIKTWQGKSKSTFESVYEGEKAKNIFFSQTIGKGQAPHKLMRQAEKNDNFFIDVENDKLSVSFNYIGPSIFIDMEKGKTIEAKSIHLPKSFIVTSDYYISSRPYRLRDGIILTRKAFKEKLPKDKMKCAGILGEIFDPRKIFLREKPIWETLPIVIEHIKNHGDIRVNGLSVKVDEYKNGDVTEYRLQMPGFIGPEEYIVKYIYFSSRCGFNISVIEVFDQSDKILHRKTIEYDLYEGIYIPKLFIEENHTYLKDGAKNSRKKTISLKEQKVNSLIPENMFTYKKLGLQNNDIFIDNIQGVKYKYNEGNLVPIND